MAMGKQVRNTKSSRRRKKRRTEDFSSDSDSSSSSSEDEKMDKTDVEIEQTVDEQHSMNIDGIQVQSDEDNDEINHETLDLDTREKLASVPFTSSEVSHLTNINKLHSINDNKIKQTTSKSRDELNGEFLKLMASGFSDDLDELRKKPDFTDKSLVMLAKTLQSGANMFDDETLDAILSK